MKKWLVRVVTIIMMIWAVPLFAQQSLDSWYNSHKTAKQEFLKLEIPRNTSNMMGEQQDSETTQTSPLVVQPNQKIYQHGDIFSLELLSQNDGYVYIHNVVPNEAPVLLFPTQSSEDNQILSNHTYSFPRNNASYRWRIGENEGFEHLLVTVTNKPLTEEQIKQIPWTPRRIEVDVDNKIQACQVKLDLPVGTSSNQEESVSPTSQTEKKRIAIVVSYLLQKEDDGNYYCSSIFPFTGGSFIQMINTLLVTKEFDTIFYLAGENMNKKYFTELLESLAEITSEGDEIFLYINTHGMSGSGPDAIPDTTGTEQSGGHEAIIFTEGEPMVDDEFSDLLMKLKHCRVMVLLETCHSGGILDSEVTSQIMSRQILTEVERKPVSDPQKFVEDLVQLAAASYSSEDFMNMVPSMLAGTSFDENRKVQESDTSSSNLSGGMTLEDFIRKQKKLKASSESEKGFMTSLTKKMNANTKDITANHPNLAIITACKYDEVARCCALNDQYQWLGIDIDNEKWIFRPIDDYSLFSISPCVFAFRLAMLDTTGKYTSDPHKTSFEDVMNILKEYLPVNNARVNSKVADEHKTQSQTPCYFNTAGPIMLRNSK